MTRWSTPLALTVLAVLCTAAAPPAAAQDGPARAALEAFRDSLAGVTDSVAVSRLERAIEAAASDERADPSASALLRLREGLVAIRHGELGNGYRFARARGAFGRAAALEPEWPWPRLGIALAHAAEFDSQRGDSLELGKRPGVGHLAEAVAELVQALERDRRFAPALIELERLAWELHEPENWRLALEAFRSVSAGEMEHPPVLLALGRLERETGDSLAAVAALGRYASLGGSPGVARLELARTRLQRGLPGGAEDYFAGAAYDDPIAVAAYRADLALVFPDSVLAEFDASRGEARSVVLRRFWENRARVELRTVEERLREHYRRLHYARRHFALSITRRHYQPGCPYRSGSMEFDDRGIIYLRHGEPTVRVRTPLFTLMPNESWRYDRADGDLVFHFGAGFDIYDYRLLASASDVLGNCTSASIPIGSLPLEDVWLSREAIDPMYAKLAAWSGTGAGDRLELEERRIGEASIEVGTTTESHQLRFERPLDAVIDLVAVGRRGDRTLAHVVFAVQGDSAIGDPVAGGWRYPVRVRVAAFGPDRRVVGYLDSTASFVTPQPIDSARQLLGRMELPLPAGTWHVRASVEIAGAGAVAPIDSVRVVASSPEGSLRVSDLAVGRRAVRLTWLAESDTVYLSPFQSHPADAELELYYEVYGLEPGAEYATRLEITPWDDGGLLRGAPPGVRLAFSDVARASTASARRTVSLADLRPGSYSLDVTITDTRGRAARSRTSLEVERPR